MHILICFFFLEKILMFSVLGVFFLQLLLLLLLLLKFDLIWYSLVNLERMSERANEWVNEQKTSLIALIWLIISFHFISFLLLLIAIKFTF